MKFVSKVTDYILDKFAYQVAREISDGLHKEMNSFVEEVRKDTKKHAEKIKKDAKKAIENALDEHDDKELEDSYGLRDYEYSDLFSESEFGECQDKSYGIDVFRRFPVLRNARRMMKLAGIIDNEEEIICPHCRKSFRLENHLWPYNFNSNAEAGAGKATKTNWGSSARNDDEGNYDLE